MTIQCQRSVVCPYRLAHPWFVGYYDEMGSTWITGVLTKEGAES